MVEGKIGSILFFTFYSEATSHFHCATLVLSQNIIVKFVTMKNSALADLSPEILR